MSMIVADESFASSESMAGVADEGLVDLERPDRELLQGRQRRVARAEVVDRQVQAHGVQLVQQLDGSASHPSSASSRDLEFETRGETSWSLKTERHCVMKLACFSCFSDSVDGHAAGMTTTSCHLR